jgi:AcrR family transcriptional regulator
MAVKSKVTASTTAGTPATGNRPQEAESMDHQASDGGRDGDTGLPASIEAAWGLRARPQKGPKPGLTLERIVAAGVTIAATEGLGAVSMSRVAAELGSSAMSLYRYVAAKDELLALMVDAASGTPPPAEPGEGWRSGLSRWAWAYLDVLRRHPWVLRIPISGPPATPHQVAWMEAALRSMRDTALAEAEKLSVLLLLSGYVRNEATLELDLATAFQAAGTAEPAAVMPGYGRMLAMLTDAERFPALHAVIAAGVFDQDDHPDTEFVFGLDRLLDGVEALVRARAPGAGPTATTAGIVAPLPECR